jgi:hypothetical protein
VSIQQLGNLSLIVSGFHNFDWQVKKP